MLNDTDLAMLALERTWWKRAGAKEQAIADRFGLTPTQYAQRLNRLIDRREAVEADPLTVARLRRTRDKAG